MRAQKPIPSGIPADVLLTLARNPDVFAEQLIDYDKREKTAIAAEGKAVEALKSAERAQAKLEADLALHRKEVAEAKTANDYAKQALDARYRELEDMKAGLNTRSDALDMKERELNSRIAGAEAEAERLVQTRARLENAEEDLVKREAALKDRSDAISNKEATFKNRLLKLVEGL